MVILNKVAEFFELDAKDVVKVLLGSIVGASAFYVVLFLYGLGGYLF